MNDSERITAVQIGVEITKDDDKGKVSSRRTVPLGFYEADIPGETMAWLVEQIRLKEK